MKPLTRRIAWAVALPVVLCGAVAAQETPDANELFARGVALHQAGDVLGAIETYQAAIDKAPERVDIRSNLGAAFAKLGRYDEAIEHYRTALSRAPDQAAIRFNLAVALYKSARIADASSELNEVVRQQPENRSALLLLADCHLQMGHDSEVVALLSPREPELKDDRLFAYLLGTALVRRNELLRGQTYIDRLFRDGDSAEARLLLGATHLERRDGVSAVQELERAIQLNPTLPTAQSLLGRALLLAGRATDAIAAFRRELDRNPNDFDSNLQLGLLLKDENRLDESYAHLTRASRLRSHDPAVFYALGALHLAMGRVEDAQKALETVTTQVPDYRHAHVLLATAYYRQKKKDLGDRHRAIATRLEAEQQSREPGAQPNLGAAHNAERAKEIGDRAAATQSPTVLAEPIEPTPSPAASLAGLDDASAAVVEKALAMNAAGNSDGAFETLRRLAHGGGENQAVIEALGLAVLRLPLMPEHIAPEKRDMIRLAGRGAYHMARVRRTALGRMAFEELVSRYPGEPNVHYAFGNYLLPEEPDAAIEEYRKELRRAPDHYPAMLQMAVAETTRGNAAAALPLAERAVEVAPDAPAGRLILGRALLEAGRTARAIEQLERAATLAPQNPGIYFSLARAYRAAGRHADAARARAEFARLDRSDR